MVFGQPCRRSISALIHTGGLHFPVGLGTSWNRRHKHHLQRPVMLKIVTSASSLCSLQVGKLQSTCLFPSPRRYALLMAMTLLLLLVGPGCIGDLKFIPRFIFFLFRRRSGLKHRLPEIVVNQ
jgi:hypothetical protein